MFGWNTGLGKCALGITIAFAVSADMMKVELHRLDFENVTRLGASINGQDVSCWGWGIGSYPDSAGFTAEGNR
jgi:hypothetical protein